jgi:hypothetical protein
MRASQKRLWISAAIFAVLFLATLLLFRFVSASDQFYAFGVVGVFFLFMTVVWAKIPIEDFQPRYGKGPYSHFVKFVSTSMLGVTALLSIGTFVLVLWIRTSRAH